MYAGKTAGPHYTQGGGADYLCLHDDPEFLEVTPGIQGHRGHLYGTEYEAFSNPPAFGDLREHNAPCAVCSTRARGETIMIPGRITCEASWTREYYGYLMTEDHSHRRSTHICVDEKAESLRGSVANTNGDLLYLVEVVCNHGLDCPPYSEGYEVTCVVCTR